MQFLGIVVIKLILRCYRRLPLQFLHILIQFGIGILRPLLNHIQVILILILRVPSCRKSPLPMIRANHLQLLLILASPSTVPSAPSFTLDLHILFQSIDLRPLLLPARLPIILRTLPLRLATIMVTLLRSPRLAKLIVFDLIIHLPCLLPQLLLQLLLHLVPSNGFSL